MHQHPRYFRREDAAAYLTETFGFPVSRAWMAKLASQGGGPVFRKAGRVPLYAKEDLDAWATARLSEPFRASGVPATDIKGE
jgi:hypothetical protein